MRVFDSLYNILNNLSTKNNIIKICPLCLLTISSKFVRITLNLIIMLIRDRSIVLASNESLDIVHHQA